MNNQAPLHLFQTAFTALLNSARQHDVALTVEATLTFLVHQAEVNARDRQVLLASEKLNHRL